MKVTCTQENLSKGLNLVAGLAGRNNNLPILNNVLLQADKEGLSLITTNLEIGIKTKVRGKIDQPGAFTVQARLLSDFVHSLKRENITITLQESLLLIEGENHQTKIKGESASEYPLIPEITADLELIVEENDFRQALSQVSFSASTDESRPELNGVLFVCDENQLTIVATDSYRLAEKKIVLKQAVKEARSIIVPVRTIQQVTKVLTEELGVEQVAIMVNENQIKFVIGQTEIISRIVIGQYPDYKQIIPTNFSTTMSFEVAELSRSIKTTALFCQPGINDVKISYVPGTGEAQVRAQNSSSGDNLSRLKAEIEGQAGDIVFNYRYVLEGLNNLGAENGLLKLNDNNGPALLTAKGDKNFIYLIMPIKQ